MEAIVFIILQIFFATRSVLKIGDCHSKICTDIVFEKLRFKMFSLRTKTKNTFPSFIFPSFSWGIFSQVTPLNQSQASENIWWIITTVILTYWAKVTDNKTNEIQCGYIKNIKVLMIFLILVTNLLEMYCARKEKFICDHSNLSPING